MALVALDGTPLVPVGFISAPQQANYALSSVLQDAAKEATIMYGQIITDDGASHTIDTTGSSALQWMSGAVTFANAGSTFKVGLATMDTATGPPARATNVTDVITLSVSKSMTGGGGLIAATTWQSHVPDAGTLTVANGDFIAFCTQLTALGGADAVNTQVCTAGISTTRPGVTPFTGAAYSAGSTLPNCVITFSDGHVGWFANSVVLISATTQTWNSGSATKEYGNYLQFPFPLKVYGIHANASFTLSADCDFVLYSDPLGTPVAEKTVSVDANAVASASARPMSLLFTSPYTTTANQPLAVIAKPGASNVSMTYKTTNTAALQITDHCGTNGYAVNRASGAFATQNSNKDRYPLGLLVGAFDAGGGTSGPAAQRLLLQRGTPY